MRNIIIGILLTALLLITAASAAPGDEDEELEGVDIGEFDESSIAPMVVVVPDPTPEIPEFPTIALPMAAILGLAFVFMRRKN
ncbi:PEF-CTERM sorting domain-containing protein [Methanomethylovorans sp.]|uniref:PEF-CTERM sorting domain-containing protein n=1 Tax=Methanomethylovorans sp. TaxID=2758717 RepID=UPI00345E2C1E